MTVFSRQYEQRIVNSVTIMRGQQRQILASLAACFRALLNVVGPLICKRVSSSHFTQCRTMIDDSPRRALEDHPV